jgi:isoprenylcysteine carboxyl methyltransferase (ICMT) family protein YpbQ
MGTAFAAQADKETADALDRPHSAVSNATGVVGLIGLLAGILAMSASDLSLGMRTLACLAACAAPMILWALIVEKVYRSPTSGLDLGHRRLLVDSLRDTVTKLNGLWSTWLIIGGFYWAVRWFEGPNYAYYFFILGLAAPLMVGLSVPYVFLVDRHLREPRDGLWHMGKLVAGDWRMVSGEVLRDHARSWFIKAFFLAFMFNILPPAVANVTLRPAEQILANIPAFVVWTVQVMFLADVCFGAVGYILTFRVLDSHIRSANPYLSAWVVTLMCYPPFVLMISGPLNYQVHTQEWMVWFRDYDVVLVAWGAVLIVLTAIYAWATVIFGIRFSNLTDRGIITNGPYRYFKHPAYLSKNLFWWLVSVPFLSTAGSDQALRNCALLLAVNAIYFLRAKTEERHLMPDPAYQRYSDWIAANGLIGILLRKLKSAPRSVRPKACCKVAPEVSARQDRPHV